MMTCLVRPPLLVPRGNQTRMLTPPLGLAYVAASVRAAGHEVIALDGVGLDMDGCRPVEGGNELLGLGVDDLVERIPDNSAIIGISAAYSFEWPNCRNLIARIRRRFPKALLIGGGEHLSALPEECLAESGLDVAVVGEGEETVAALMDALGNGGGGFAQVAGIVFKENGEIIATPRRQRLRSIDAIPLPAWDLFPIEAYLDRHAGFGVNRGRSMPVLASRGCPYRCTFCSSPQMWTTRWISRDPGLLLDEMAGHGRKYGVTNFDFYDLTAIVNKRWIKTFCQQILDRGAAFTWQLPSGTRIEALDGEVAELLFRSGCRNVSYSVESGSPAVLKRIKKKIDRELFLRTLRESADRGLNVKCNVIFGFPRETYGEVAQSFRFIARMALTGAHDLSTWAFIPYPGSEMFEELRRQGRIDLDEAYYDSLRSYADTANTISHSEHFSSTALKRIRVAGQLLFYGLSWLRRPWRPFRMIVNAFRGVQESRSEMFLENKLQGIPVFGKLSRRFRARG